MISCSSFKSIVALRMCDANLKYLTLLSDLWISRRLPGFRLKKSAESSRDVLKAGENATSESVRGKKKGDLMQLDLALKVLRCSDKTFMSQKGWIPKLS